MIPVLHGRADTSDGRLDSGLACAYARAGRTDRRAGRMRQCFIPAGGGRGFNSFERGRPATAPTVMRRFFPSAETFALFSRNQTIKRRARQFLLAKQSGPINEALAFARLFSRRPEGGHIRKMSRNSRGEGP
jgi:hypothetical protein